MSNKKKFEVDEEALRKMMASTTETYLFGEVPKSDEKEPDMQEDDEIAPEEVSVQKQENQPLPDYDAGKGNKKRKIPKSDFSELFLKERVVKNRKQIYISVETCDMIQSYLKYISDVSFIAYIDNILVQHIEENKGAIKELFDKRVNPF
jgi:hypothetical protein